MKPHRHRKHTVVDDVWHKILGAVFFIFVLLYICGSCTSR